jgi:hypothetical protein
MQLPTDNRPCAIAVDDNDTRMAPIVKMILIMKDPPPMVANDRRAKSLLRRNGWRLS